MSLVTTIINIKDITDEEFNIILGDFNHRKCDDVEVENHSMKLMTSMSSPFDEIKRISIKHPNYKFNIRFATDDLGINVGNYNLINGNMENVDIPEKLSSKAIKMAMEITGDTYYIDNFLSVIEEYEMDDKFPRTCINLAYECRRLDDDIPQHILKEFERLSVMDEDYEFAGKVIKLIK